MDVFECKTKYPIGLMLYIRDAYMANDVFFGRGAHGKGGPRLQQARIPLLRILRRIPPNPNVVRAAEGRVGQIREGLLFQLHVG